MKVTRANILNNNFFKTTNFDRFHRKALSHVWRYQHIVNLLSSRISEQNTYFNKYTETSKRQRGFQCNNCHSKYLKTTNFELPRPQSLKIYLKSLTFIDNGDVIC